MATIRMFPMVRLKQMAILELYNSERIKFESALELALVLDDRASEHNLNDCEKTKNNLCLFLGLVCRAQET